MSEPRMNQCPKVMHLTCACGVYTTDIPVGTVLLVAVPGGIESGDSLAFLFTCNGCGAGFKPVAPQNRLWAATLSGAVFRRPGSGRGWPTPFTPVIMTQRVVVVAPLSRLARRLGRRFGGAQ